MKLSRPQPQEPAKQAKAPAVDQGVVHTAASASMGVGGHVAAAEPLASELALFLPGASGATGVRDYDPPLEGTMESGQGVHPYEAAEKLKMLGTLGAFGARRNGILDSVQTRLLLDVAGTFQAQSFDLGQVNLQGLPKYVVRDSLNSMIPLGLLDGPLVVRNTSWRLTPAGESLAASLKAVQSRLDEINSESARRELEHPKPFKIEKWDLDYHHQTISDFIDMIQSGEFDPTEGDGEMDFTGAFYADASHSSRLKVDIQAMLKGDWDTRFTHVLITHSNMENK